MIGEDIQADMDNLAQLPVMALTGRRRYRRNDVQGDGVKSTLILQVEVSEFVRTFKGKPRWVCVWRDATADDVLAGEIYAG